MYLVRSLLMVALVTPLALAGPRENALHRRTGDDDKGNDSSSSAISIPIGPTPSATLSFTTSSPKDESSPASTSGQIVTQSTSTELTIGSSQPTLLASFPCGTGGSSAPQSTVAILTTEVVYTTLTTCPITSTVTSGTQAVEKVTSVLSTVTRTSTSTICTKCIAPPKAKTISSLTSVGITATTTLSSSVIYSVTQPSAGLPHASSKPEIPGTPITASSSKGLGFLSAVSLTVPATLTDSASGGFSGYAAVPSPASTPGDKGPLANATSSILPVFTPSLLGHGYGGGYVGTPSVYVTKLPFPNGPSEGVPPGYGFSSRPETFVGTSSGLQPSSTLVENSTFIFTSLGSPSSTPFTVFTGLGLPSSTAFNVGNVTYEVSLPAATASLLSSVVSILNAPSVPATTYTSQLAVSGSSSAASAVIVEGSGFGFAVMGPQDSSSESTGVEASTAAIATSPTVSATGSQGQSLPAASVNAMPISMSANGAPIFASSTTSIAAVAAASHVTGTPNPEIAPTASISIIGGSETSSGFLSNVPAVLITHTATSGEVIVETSSPPPVFISSTASNFELIVTTSTPSPVLVSQTASSGQVFVQTSTPPAVFVSSAGANPTSLAIGSPIPIGVVASPTSSPGQVVGAPITLNATSTSGDQGPASGQSAATVLSPVVGGSGLTSFAVIASSAEQTSSAGQPTPAIGANGLTSLAIIASSAGQPAATILTPVVGANGLTSLAVIASPVEQVASTNQPVATVLTPVVGANGLTSLAVVPTPVEQTAQPAATILTPVVGFNGLTSLAVIPSPVVGANGLTSLAVFSTPVAAANGLASPAVILTPVVGANGVTSLAVLATPVIGANGLTSLAIGLQGQQGTSGTPSPIEATIPAPVTPTPPIFGPGPVLGSLFPSISSTPSTGSDSNSSVHVPLNPSTIAQFEGSAFKLSLSFGMYLVSFIVYVLFL